MRKTIFAVMAIGLLTITSCSKNTPTGNSWIFRTVTYNTTSCTGTGATLSASSMTSNNSTSYGTLTCTFFGTTLPGSGGTYTVVSTIPINSTQVAITGTTDGTANNYKSTGGNGSNQTVTISVSNGKVSVTGSGVELVNLVSPADSSALSVNITQY